MKKRYILLWVLLVIGVIFFVLLKATPTNAPINENPTPAPVNPNTSFEPTPAPAPATKDDMIVLESPLPGAKISSPLTIKGKARGNWFFEGSAPVSLTNWDGLIIAEGYVTAQGEWMTTEYVPFVGTLKFTKPVNVPNNSGSLILRKDNPSGEPRFDNALEIQITF